MNLIQATDLTRYYGTHCAVDEVSFELNAGDILGFLGPNGAGKSTTMQMLCGTLAPSAGGITIGGIDLLERPKAAKRVLGYLPEQPPVYKEMTVDEYLVYCARLHGIRGSQISSAVDIAKQRCGLGDNGRRLIGNLSKGFQQRVGIAQAIVHSPQVIILDEPTVGLDPIQIREIRELIIELGKAHGIILSTHILPEVQAVCNRVQIINQGRLVFESTMQNLQHREAVNHYRVGFANAVSAIQVQAMDCVDTVVDKEDGFIVTLNAPAHEFVQASVTANWNLCQLVPLQQTLEQIFVSLAHQEDEQQNSAEEQAA